MLSFKIISSIVIPKGTPISSILEYLFPIESTLSILWEIPIWTGTYLKGSFIRNRSIFYNDIFHDLKQFKDKKKEENNWKI